MPFKKNAPKGTQQPSDAKRIFIARTNELLFFIHHILEPEEPTYNIISVSGQSGVGKSTLVNRLIDEARAANFKDYCLTAKVDERQTTPASIMQCFAEQLRDAGQPLKKFEEKLTTYKESLRRMHAGHKEEQEILVRETVDTAGAIAEDIPFVGGLMRKGANTFTEILIEKGRMGQYLKDAAKLEDPIGDLTRAFVKDLNQIVETQVGIGSYRIKRQHRVILFLDTFEQLASDATPWLLDHFLEADISPNAVLVVAGRDSIENSTSDDPKRWLPYFDNQDIYLITLNSFTEQETQVFLEERGITNPVKTSQMWHMSRGLPLYLGLLTSNPQGNVDPTADVVENFLRWIPKDENLKRRLALDAALFSLPFNQDDLAAFTYLEHEQSTLYQWLIAQPFVRSNPQDGRHIYHDLAQEMFSRHLYQRSPRGCHATRQALANYYQQRIEKLQSEGGKEVYKSDEWLELTLASAQQLFLLPDEDSHRRAIEQILIADEDAREREEIVRVLRNLPQPYSSNQISPGLQYFIEQLLHYIEASLAHQDQEFVATASSLLEKITHMPSFSTEALAYLYRRRGRAYRYLKDYPRAIQDYNRAVELNPTYAIAHSDRGRAYRALKDYQNALSALDRTLELDSHYTWAYNERGLTYYDLKDYPRAIQDYNRAVELDSTYKWAYNNRGAVYYSLQDYQRAIQDYSRALELDPTYAIVYADRGRAYSALKDYDHALQDYDHAIELDPEYASAYFGRGSVYLWLRDLSRAKAEFMRSWQLDSTDVNYGWMVEFVDMCQQQPDLAVVERLEVLAQVNLQRCEAHCCRGVAQFLRGNAAEALTELEIASVIEPDFEDTYFWKGIVYAYLEQDDEAIAAIERSLEQGLPPILLTPLHWFERDRPAFYEKYAKPLPARYE